MLRRLNLNCLPFRLFTRLESEMMNGNVAAAPADFGAAAFASPSGDAPVPDEALWSRRRTLRLICLYKEAKAKPRDYKCVFS